MGKAPFGMATAFDVKGGCRQIYTAGYPVCAAAQCVIESIQAVNPHGGFLHFGLEVGLLVARETLDVGIRGRTPAMMSFIVEHHNGHPISKIAEHTPGKHRWCFWSLVDHSVSPLPFFVFRLRRKGMPVGDQHLTLL